MTSEALNVENWLREQCADYAFDLGGIFRRRTDISWPVVANSEQELQQLLESTGQIMPLPKESAALANILEVSIVDFILGRVDTVPGATAERGNERGYPDLEISGEAFGGGFHAVDVKMARRGRTKTGRLTANTQSRVTLYTGNTYFRYPSLHWPGTFRPFNDYASHLDVLGVYTLNVESKARVDDLEWIVQPPWKIGSKHRSSTTREYIGAVKSVEDLREGQGDFGSPAEFYTFWRKHNFKIGKVVQQQLDKLLNDQ
ncbi:type II restriction endonuclease [Gordonia soli]|uniref:Putative type II restriction enzyme n=1 Tax=Gordonia soli NBRC 108243 TaxID=1223545 RepID=M0QFW5_9ACTN|nr:type II restriction endonuclease [Gordonia soli]GAC67505.1 putative type II restriction enzyme [Gordonia soli NBRC 108243]